MNNDDTANDFIDSYFAVWNRGDVNAVQERFAPEGRYQDPSVGEIAPDSLRAYLSDLRKSFPDLSWQRMNSAMYVPSQNSIVCEWVMTGTHLGPLDGTPLGIPLDLPPTNRVGMARGVDILRLDRNNRILHHMTHFDRHALYTSLGLSIIVHPKSLYGVSIGWAAYLPGPATREPPNAYAATWITPRDQSEGKEIVTTTQEIIFEAAASAGFHGLVAAIFEDRMFTISAWASISDATAAAQSPAHRSAIERFRSNQLGGSQHAVITEVRHRGGVMKPEAADIATISPTDELQSWW